MVVVGGSVVVVAGDGVVVVAGGGVVAKLFDVTLIIPIDTKAID